MKSNRAKKIDSNLQINVKPSVRRLRDLLPQVEEKRRSEMIRFHTCCADPRASK